MKVLILTKKEHHKWLYHLIADYLSEHDIHTWSDGIYPFDTLRLYDAGISFMYTHKIPADQVNTHKWFNFHPAPLPEYKGRNLCYHAIMNGETEFGASLHFMDENFDTGDIIDVWHTTIAPHQTAGDVYREAIETSKAMFVEYFPQILNGEFFSVTPNVGGTYYKKEPIDNTLYLTEEDIRKIRAITYGDFYPKIDIGGVIYKVVRE